jgi:hypothetical protein
MNGMPASSVAASSRSGIGTATATSIDEREFSNALFEAWDEDENLRLDEDEFETGVNAL